MSSITRWRARATASAIDGPAPTIGQISGGGGQPPSGPNPPRSAHRPNSAARAAMSERSGSPIRNTWNWHIGGGGRHSVRLSLASTSMQPWCGRRL